MRGSKRLRLSNIPASQNGEKVFTKYLATVHSLYLGRDYTHITCFPSHAILTFATKEEASVAKQKLEFTLCCGFHLNAEYDKKGHAHANENSVYVHKFKHEDIPKLRDQVANMPGLKEIFIRYSKQSLYAFVDFSSAEKAQFAVTQLNKFWHATIKSDKIQQNSNNNSTNQNSPTSNNFSGTTNNRTKSQNTTSTTNISNSKLSPNTNFSVYSHSPKSILSPNIDKPTTSTTSAENSVNSNFSNISQNVIPQNSSPPNFGNNSSPEPKVATARPSKYTMSRSKSPQIPSKTSISPQASPSISPQFSNFLSNSPQLSLNPQLVNSLNSNLFPNSQHNSTNPLSNVFSTSSNSNSPQLATSTNLNSTNTNPKSPNPTNPNPTNQNSTNPSPTHPPKPATSKSRQFSVYVSGLPNEIFKSSEFSTFIAAHTQGAIDCVYKGTSKRYGFANYSSPESAINAISILNGMVLGETRLAARIPDKSKDLTQTSWLPTFHTSTLKVENLSPMIKDDLLRKIFSLATKPEDILAAHVVTNSNGNSKQYGFVEFSNRESVESACQKMNGKTFMDYNLSLSVMKNENSTMIKVINIPYSLGTEELNTLIQQQNEEYCICFVPRKKDGTSPSYGVVMVESIAAGKQLIQKLDNLQLQGRPIKAVLYGSNSKMEEKANAVQKIEDMIDVKRQEQIEIHEASVLLKKQQENLVATKEQLEQRLKIKREQQQKEEDIRKELEAYKDQLRVAKLEKEIEQFKVQKEQQERELAILASIDTLNAQKELKQMQENISKFEEEINEKRNIKQEILMLQAKKKAYDIEMECAPPTWESELGWEPKEPAQLYMFKIDKGRLETVWHRQCTVQISPKPFGRGTFRLAYWLKLWDKKDERYSGGCEKFVAKRPIASHADNDMSTCKQDILTQMYAAEMARLFCNSNVPKRVEYVPIYLICLTTRPEKTYMTIESVLDGEWKRYSNNKGFVHSESAATVHAFSHFSYEQSSVPKKIVVDIQGVKHEDKFMLTDPSVHCEGSKTYGESNLGEEGINEFFKTHCCNHICQLLKLSRHSMQPNEAL